MSLDWYLIADKCPHCGHRPDLPDLNITHNLAPIPALPQLMPTHGGDQWRGLARTHSGEAVDAS